MSAPAILAELRCRARRLSLLGELIDTFPEPAERERVVMRLHRAQLVSADSARLLIERLALDATLEARGR